MNELVDRPSRSAFGLHPFVVWRRGLGSTWPEARAAREWDYSMEQVSMSDLRERLAEIQGGLREDLGATKEDVRLSDLARALSEVFRMIDTLAAAIEELQTK